MNFDPTLYGTEVAAILALDGNGARLMPLSIDGARSEEGAKRLAGSTAAALFPRAAHPDAALSGLWLYFSCFDEAHNIAQAIPDSNGSFWHGVLHRQEPDPGNAAYWFRRVGAHPIFPALREEAKTIGFESGSNWDPMAFIDFCESARMKPSCDVARIAREVQRSEWQLLFHHCARPKP